MRRRRVDSGSNYSEECEYLDEDDQEKLVEDLEFDLERQHIQFSRIFRILCFATAVASIFFTIVDEIQVANLSASVRFWRFLHGSLASAIQLSIIEVPISASVVSKDLMRTVYLPLIANGVILVYLVRVGRYDSEVDNATHFGLAAANFVTLSGALLLRWDKHDAKRALGELDQARYHFKSL